MVKKFLRYHRRYYSRKWQGNRFVIRLGIEDIKKGFLTFFRNFVFFMTKQGEETRVVSVFLIL
jgi:hypothetical protein